MAQNGQPQPSISTVEGASGLNKSDDVVDKVIQVQVEDSEKELEIKKSIKVSGKSVCSPTSSNQENQKDLSNSETDSNQTNTLQTANKQRRRPLPSLLHDLTDRKGTGFNNNKNRNQSPTTTTEYDEVYHFNLILSGPALWAMEWQWAQSLAPASLTSSNIDR